MSVDIKKTSVFEKIEQRKREISRMFSLEAEILWEMLHNEEKLKRTNEIVAFRMPFPVDLSESTVDEALELFPPSSEFRAFVEKCRKERFIVRTYTFGLTFSTAALNLRLAQYGKFLAQRSFDKFVRGNAAVVCSTWRKDLGGRGCWPNSSSVEIDMAIFFDLCRQKKYVCHSYSSGFLIAKNSKVAAERFNAQTYVSREKCKSVESLSKAQLQQLRTMQNELEAGESKMFAWPDANPNLDKALADSNDGDVLRLLCCDVSNKMVLTMHGFVLCRSDDETRWLSAIYHRKPICFDRVGEVHGIIVRGKMVRQSVQQSVQQKLEKEEESGEESGGEVRCTSWHEAYIKIFGAPVPILVFDENGKVERLDPALVTVEQYEESAESTLRNAYTFFSKFKNPRKQFDALQCEKYSKIGRIKIVKS